MKAFAFDLARWLHGDPRSSLGALARVVTLVAQRDLRDARALCRERPLLSVEAAARATQALWPLLRGPEEPDVPPEQPEAPPEPEPSEGEEGEGVPGTGAGGLGGGEGTGDGEGEAEESDGDGDGEGDQEGDGDGSEGDGEGAGDDEEAADGGPPGDPMDVLAALAEMDHLADPELDALAERLRERMGGEGDAGAEAGELLAEAGSAAAEGALETDRVARHLERFLPGVGWSGAPGNLERALLEQLDGLTLLLSKLQDLNELADALGRMEEPTQKRGMIQGGREEVVGVNLGGEVALALPSELALLADEDTEDLFYQRYIERRLISLELTGAGLDGAAAGEKRGPVIACIDTSGSMEGAPELAAKALVLAVCRRVLPRNRTVHLILFGGEAEQTELRLKRGRGGLEGLLAFLGASFHSGTDFDGPLLRAMDLLEDQDLKLADILVVTDGLCRATPAVVRRVNEVRDAQGARIWSVVLGHTDARGVEPFSHHVYLLDPTGAAEATGLLRRF